jgi:outer membrane protein assembly factor BamB
MAERNWKTAAAAATAMVLCFVAGGAGGDWPQFRGPNQDGISPEKGLLRSWGEGGPEVLWTVPLGVGYGGASVRDGEVYVLDRVGKVQDVLRCLDLGTGRELWRYAYDAPGKLAHPGSRSTPTVDDKYVFTIGPFGHMHCIDRSSHAPVWSKHLLKDFGGEIPMWGVAQSPALYRDTVIIAPLSKKAGVVGLAKTTGKELWRSPPLGGMGYVSPRIVNLGGVDQVLIISATRLSKTSTRGSGHGRATARRAPAHPADSPRRGPGHGSTGSRPGRQPPDYLPRVANRVAGVGAADGRLLWTYDEWRCANPIPNPTPVGDDRVFVTGGYMAGSVMLKVRPEQDRFTVAPLFTLPDYGSQVPNPLLHEGHLYVLCNGNFRRDGLVCVDLEGNVKWKTNRDPNLDRGHTLIADGLMYSMDGAKGILRLIEPTPAGYKEISQVKLLGGKEIWAPMALADGKLLIRDQHQMKCLDVKLPHPRE